MDLRSYSPNELLELIKSLGEPSYRAKQIFEGIHKGKKVDEMTNIPKTLREKLNQMPFGGAEIVKCLKSERDGTKKYLLKLDDGNLIESVFMPYNHGNTLCVSTQVGCNMGCVFCASTLEGKVRDLTAGEILAQVFAAERDNRTDDGSRAVTNIVMMGSGEPLDNYDNSVKFIKLVSDPAGINISRRNISLSTCGLTDKIIRLIDDDIHVTLSISLHAPNEELRMTLMPVNRAYPVNGVLSAAKQYADKTRRRVIIEYSLIDGVNDTDACINELARVLRGINCHVNLIPLNSVKERDLNGTDRSKATVICKKLNALGQSATIRREMGADIEGACGQLRRRTLGEGGI